MGVSAFGALVAIALAFLAQSPRLLTRLRLNGQRLDLRAKSFTGYGLALLLLAMGFFVAGVPLGTGGFTPLVTGNEPGITALSPADGASFAPDDTITFDWFYPEAAGADQQFVVYLIDGAQEIALGSLTEPNNGAAYRLPVVVADLPATGDLIWQARLQTLNGEALAESEAIPLLITASEEIAGGESGAMVGLATATPGGNSGAIIGLATADLSATGVITGTAELSLPPGAVTGSPDAPTASPAPEETAPPTATLTPVPTATATPTPAPTLTPTPILGPTARVGEDTSTLPMRQLPGGPVLVVLVRGDTVLPLSGHAFHSGELWREISTVQGVIGWVPDQFLEYGEE